MTEQTRTRTAGLVLTSTQVVQHPARVPEIWSDIAEAEEELLDWGGKSPKREVHISEFQTGEPSEGGDVTKQRSAGEGQTEEQQQAQAAPATGLLGSVGGTESRYDATHGKSAQS